MASNVDALEHPWRWGVKPVGRWSAAFCLVAGFLAGSCANPAGPGPLRPDEPLKMVWVVGHGWHVGLALRREDVSAEAWPEAADVGRVRFLEVGWGDGEFYPAPRGTSGMAIRAAFFSRSSVLHVAGFDSPPADYFAASPVVEVRLASGGLDALARFIREVYAREAGGGLVRVAPALYGRGWFYRARLHYRVLENSNTWAARALAIGGCPETAGRALTAEAVLEQASRCGRVVRGPSGAPARPGGPRERMRRRRFARLRGGPGRSTLPRERREQSGGDRSAPADRAKLTKEAVNAREDRNG